MKEDSEDRGGGGGESKQQRMKQDVRAAQD